jgi:hypothetical protein
VIDQFWAEALALLSAWYKAPACERIFFLDDLVCYVALRVGL